jgi:5-methylcytosine-specific restriction protein A
MPTEAKTICPGCHRAIVSKGERCPTCREKYRTQRRNTPSKPTDPFLGSIAWQKLRRAKLLANPLCECCEKAGRTTAAQQVHHKQARQDAPELAMNWNNLESVCTRCHRAYTVQATQERRERQDG